MPADFDDFAEDAAALFGLNTQEAASLLDILEEGGFDLEEDELKDHMPEAFDVLDDISDDFGYDYDEYYDLDPDFPDDDYLDPGDYWELSALYED